VTLADGSRVTMSRGFHAFFRQYYNLRALLRRTDPDLDMLTGLPDYPLVHADGLRDSFRYVPRTPPWSALGFAALSPAFRGRDLLRMRPRAALPLLDVRVPEVYERLDGVSARDLLASIRFPPAAHHLAFEVFSRSFFADPGELSAAEMVLMFHIYFLGSGEGLLFDVPREPFPTALWDPLADRLTGLGVDIRTGTAVEGVDPAPDGGCVLRVSGASATRYDALVLALDTGGLKAVVEGSPELATEEWRAGITRLRNAPPFLVSRLWLDRPVAPDRPGFLGTGGFGTLDNVSVLERWEGEAARWAARTGGSVVELHAYALDGRTTGQVASRSDGAGGAGSSGSSGTAGPSGRSGPSGLHDRSGASGREYEQRRLVGQLHRVYPETRDARIVDARHEWRADCPLFAVGTHSGRPTVRTPDPAVVVAGDLVRTRLPVALMERAATTGFLAAGALLERWGVRGPTLWTVPRQGRTALLRGLARLGDA
jgi:isorenieratene synthase